MADLEAHYRLHLTAEFERRKLRNSRYSLRAYARALNVDNGFLSKLMSGKALLSLDLADTLCAKLKLDPQTRARFLLSAAEEQKCHALYLIDPSLTDCDPALDSINALPVNNRRNINKNK